MPLHPSPASHPSNADLLVLLCTFPTAEIASSIAHALLEERLCACVNLIPGVTSLYRWQTKVTADQEIVGIIKTTASTYPALLDRFLSLHPYQVPELIALPIAAVSSSYLSWVTAEVSG